jgi:hypothetical protein
MLLPEGHRLENARLVVPKAGRPPWLVQYSNTVQYRTARLGKYLLGGGRGKEQDEGMAVGGQDTGKHLVHGWRQRRRGCWSSSEKLLLLSSMFHAVLGALLLACDLSYSHEIDRGPTCVAHVRVHVCKYV